MNDKQAAYGIMVSCVCGMISTRMSESIETNNARSIISLGGTRMVRVSVRVHPVVSRHEKIMQGHKTWVRDELAEVISNEDEQLRMERAKAGRACSFGPSFGFAFGGESSDDSDAELNKGRRMSTVSRKSRK